MTAFPQPGGCLCGDIRYTLGEDPVTLYACHCTDCQRETGSSFVLSMVVRLEALELTRGDPGWYSIELADGRVKRSNFCVRCSSRIWSVSRVSGLALLEAGTLDDTSWFRPAGHIWTASAQPWVPIPEDALRFEGQPRPEEMLDMVRAWKRRSSGVVA